MNAKSFSSFLLAFAAAALLSFGAFQTAFAAEGDLSAAGAEALAGDTANGELAAQAVTWRTIMTPEQLRVISLKSEGFGPGYYKIGADFTLGEQESGNEIGTCALLSGNFVIDFNGHTVQSSCEKMCTFIVQDANVTFMDSKASSDKVSVNSWGLGCVEVRGGSVTVESGNYLCQKFTDAGGVGIFVGGGTTTINGGAFKGTQAGATTSGGTTTFNGGTFYGGYPWAFLYLGGTVKIVRGEFYGGTGGGGYSFAIGAMSLGNVVDFTPFFAKGSTWNESTVCYWNGNSNISYTPDRLFLPYAALTSSAIVVQGPQTITASNLKKAFGSKAFNLNAKTNGNGKLSYASSNKKVATVNSAGRVTIKNPGTTRITIKASGTDTSKPASKTITLKVSKAKNTLAAKGLTKSVSVKKVAKKAQTTAKAVKVSKNKGSVTFTKASGSNKLKIAKKTGKVTVKRGTKKGTYRIKVKVTAAGNANYNKGSRTVTVTVKVK